MIKGVVIKSKKNYSILLSNGKFYKIKNKGTMKEGEKIMVNAEDIIMEKRKKNFGINKYIGIAVAVALIFGVVFTSLDFGNQAYAVATVDINPSVELELNKDYEVIKMIALNKDGETLKDLKVKGMEIEDAIELIVDEAEKKGFIKDEEDPYVLVTTVVVDKKLKNEKEENGVNKTIKKQIQVKAGNSKILKKVNIAINSASKEIYKEFSKEYKSKNKKENKIPIGIYMANNKIDIKDFKSLQEFFDDDDNVKLFEKNGDIIVNTRDKLNKLVDELVKLEKENNIGIDTDELIEEAKELSKRDTNDLEELFDDMEDLVDEIEDAIDDIEDQDDYDDIDDEDEDDYDDDDQYEDDDEDEEDDDDDQDDVDDEDDDQNDEYDDEDDNQEDDKDDEIDKDDDDNQDQDDDQDDEDEEYEDEDDDDDDQDDKDDDKNDVDDQDDDDDEYNDENDDDDIDEDNYYDNDDDDNQEDDDDDDDDEEDED